jgi:hypothetical protein
LPEPFAPAVRVIHELLLPAVHAQPAVAVTATVPVVALDVTDRLVGAIDGVEHAGENEKLFEVVLATDPPGPYAATRASNSRPGVGS